MVLVNGSRRHRGAYSRAFSTPEGAPLAELQGATLPELRLGLRRLRSLLPLAHPRLRRRRIRHRGRRRRPLRARRRRLPGHPLRLGIRFRGRELSLGPNEADECSVLIRANRRRCCRRIGRTIHGHAGRRTERTGKSHGRGHAGASHTHGRGHAGAPHAHGRGHAGAPHAHGRGHAGASRTHGRGHAGAPHAHGRGHAGAPHAHGRGHAGAPHTHGRWHAGASHAHGRGHAGASHAHGRGHAGAPHTHGRGRAGPLTRIVVDRLHIVPISARRPVASILHLAFRTQRPGSKCGGRSTHTCSTASHRWCCRKRTPAGHAVGLLEVGDWDVEKVLLQSGRDAAAPVVDGRGHEGGPRGCLRAGLRHEGVVLLLARRGRPSVFNLILGQRRASLRPVSSRRQSGRRERGGATRRAKRSPEVRVGRIEEVVLQTRRTVTAIRADGGIGAPSPAVAARLRPLACIPAPATRNWRLNSKPGGSAARAPTSTGLCLRCNTCLRLGWSPGLCLRCGQRRGALICPVRPPEIRVGRIEEVVLQTRRTVTPFRTNRSRGVGASSRTVAARLRPLACIPAPATRNWRLNSKPGGSSARAPTSTGLCLRCNTCLRLRWSPGLCLRCGQRRGALICPVRPPEIRVGRIEEVVLQTRRTVTPFRTNRSRGAGASSRTVAARLRPLACIPALAARNRRLNSKRSGNCARIPTSSTSRARCSRRAAKAHSRLQPG
eukprot:scaffold8357_cov114-Isochrysis_galbana.AAC.8